MPELAEVQTVLDTIKEQLGYFTIEDVEICYENLIATSHPYEFIQTMKGKRVHAYLRHGKYLMFDLETHMWMVHLRMEGKFYIDEYPTYQQKHIHAIFTLKDGRKLYYHDTRKFGRMYLYKKNNDQHYPCLKTLGLDLFDPSLQSIDLYRTFKQKKYTLKQALLDQSNVAGIGNIYADEICFALALHPETKVNRLSKKDCEKLLIEARRILSEAIACGGTTIRSYTSSLGVDGRFQLQLKVHNKKGETCEQCGHPIIKKFVAQRGTYYCPTCQKRK